MRRNRTPTYRGEVAQRWRYRDGSGEIQLHAREDLLGKEAFELLVNLDLGDGMAEFLLLAYEGGDNVVDPRNAELLVESRDCREPRRRALPSS